MSSNNFSGNKKRNNANLNLPKYPRNRVKKQSVRQVHNISYLMGQSVQGFWRNRGMTVATIIVLTLCIVATGSFFVLIKNINLNLSDLGNTDELVVYINDNFTDDQTSEVGKSIEKLDDVKSITFIGKETALQEEKEKFSDYPHLFDGLDNENNPYRDSFVVTYKNGTETNSLRESLLKISGIEKVNSKSDIANSVSTFKRAASFIFFIFAAGLYIVTFFVIMTTIKQTFNSRRQEISVMRYVGATDSFIRIPFVIEGALIGLIAGVLSAIALFLLYSYISNIFSSDYKIIKMLAVSEVMPAVTSTFIALGIIFGAFGSFISIRKFSKV